MFSLNLMEQGAGKMAQWMRALASFVKALGSVSSTYIRWLQLPLTLVLRDPMTSSGL